MKMPRDVEHTQSPHDLHGANAERLRTELLRFLTPRTGDPALAEDLVQDALVRVLDGLPSFRARAELRTWARRIALNVWYDHLRRRLASPIERAAKGDPLSVLSVLDSIGPNPPAPAPEDECGLRLTRKCLLAAARRLPEPERDIVLLHDLAGVPIEDAAARLGCSIGAAKVRLHRGRRHLGEICRADCTDELASDGMTLCARKAKSAEGAFDAQQGKRKHTEKRNPKRRN